MAIAFDAATESDTAFPTTTTSTTRFQFNHTAGTSASGAVVFTNSYAPSTSIPKVTDVWYGDIALKNVESVRNAASSNNALLCAWDLEKDLTCMILSGKTLTSNAGKTKQTRSGVKYEAGFWIIVDKYFSDSTYKGAFTTDLESGTLSALNLPQYYEAHNIAYTGTYWVAVGEDRTLSASGGGLRPFLLYSTSLSGPWTARDMSGYGALVSSMDVAYGNGYAVVVFNQNITYSSTITGTWSSASWGVPPTGISLTNVAYGNGYWAISTDCGDFFTAPVAPRVLTRASTPNGTWTTSWTATTSTPGFGDLQYRPDENVWTMTNWQAQSFIWYRNATPNGTWTAVPIYDSRTEGTPSPVSNNFSGSGAFLTRWKGLWVLGGEINQSGVYYLRVSDSLTGNIWEPHWTRVTGLTFTTSPQLIEGLATDGKTLAYICGSRLLRNLYEEEMVFSSGTQQVSVASSSSYTYAVAVSVTGQSPITVTVPFTSSSTASPIEVSVTDGNLSPPSLRFGSYISSHSTILTDSSLTTSGRISNGPNSTWVHYIQRTTNPFTSGVVRENAAGTGSRPIGFVGGAAAGNNWAAFLYADIAESIVPWTVS